MSLKSSLASAKALSETFAALGDAEKVLSDAVRAEALLANQKQALATLAAEIGAASANKAKTIEAADLILADANEKLAKANAEAKAIVDHATDVAAKTIENATTEAEGIIATANAKWTVAEATIKALEDRAAKAKADADAQEARLEKARAAVAKLLDK